MSSWTTRASADLNIFGIQNSEGISHWCLRNCQPHRTTLWNPTVIFNGISSWTCSCNSCDARKWVCLFTNEKMFTVAWPKTCFKRSRFIQTSWKTVRGILHIPFVLPNEPEHLLTCQQQCCSSAQKNDIWIFIPHFLGWLGNRVLSVLDSGAEVPVL